MQITATTYKQNNLSFSCWNTNPKCKNIGDIPELTCAKCGVVMLTPGQSRNYFDAIREKNPEDIYLRKYARARDSIKIFSEVKKYVKPLEQKVITILEELAEKYPNHTFEEIFQNPKVISPYIEKVELKNQKQKAACQEIFSKMQEILPPLTLEENKTLYRMNEKAFTISVSKSDNTSKRFRLLRMYSEFINNIQDEKTKREFINLIGKIPLKKMTPDRFIVSFIGKSDDKILNALLLSCNSTTAYITDKKQENQALCMCSNCNTVSSNMPFATTLSLYPEFAQNIQKQINTIISYITRGHLKAHRNYPEQVRESLLSASGGKLDINIDEIKPYMEEIKDVDNEKRIWEEQMIRQPESISSINNRIGRMRKILKTLKIRPDRNELLINKYEYWLNLYEKKRLYLQGNG